MPDAIAPPASPGIDPALIDDAMRAGRGSAAPPRELKQQMDGEVFMHLLVTQLANQDPSSPMDTNDMIAQTTQLASMEQLTQMGTTMSGMAEVQHQLLSMDQRAAASSLLGQVVTTADGPDGEEPITGVVTGISFDGGEPMVAVDGRAVAYSTIAAVAAPPAEEDRT
ncbi:flagellar hook assembly protein FlgD [Nesterenkonia sp. NBAIMH1]|uniref:flagellar hook assembly protein FlgD n=1 Tax=Nesterenkonia sp. NBAIMH1 TaxID=2600320 RepID=UPI001FEE31F6|nr:flagellar hook capping FlgD N-terminal domain-containing protein [Nesterenkonia sp. NBAIMH1]